MGFIAPRPCPTNKKIGAWLPEGLPLGFWGLEICICTACCERTGLSSWLRTVRGSALAKQFGNGMALWFCAWAVLPRHDRKFTHAGAQALEEERWGALDALCRLTGKKEDILRMIAREEKLVDVAVVEVIDDGGWW